MLVSASERAKNERTLEEAWRSEASDAVLNRVVPERFTTKFVRHSKHAFADVIVRMTRPTVQRIAGRIGNYPFHESTTKTRCGKRSIPKSREGRRGMHRRGGLQQSPFRSSTAVVFSQLHVMLLANTRSRRHEKKARGFGERTELEARDEVLMSDRLSEVSVKTGFHRTKRV